jgi:hypothetical protein
VAEFWNPQALRTVTPAFTGRFESVGVRPVELPFAVPSLRGVLAFWLRALAGAHLGNSIQALHNVDSAVLGAARTGKTNLGRGRSGRSSAAGRRGGADQAVSASPGLDPEQQRRARHGAQLMAQSDIRTVRMPAADTRGSDDRDVSCVA